MNRYKTLMIILLNMFSAIGSVRAHDSLYMTMSGTPGEMWFLHSDPCEQIIGIEAAFSLRHSSDYGRTWSIPREDLGGFVACNRKTNTLTTPFYEENEDGDLLVTHDNFATHEIWRGRCHGSGHTWLPDTTAMLAFSYNFGAYSFDSLRTYVYPRRINEHNNIRLLERNSSIGWSTNDMLTYSHTIGEDPDILRFYMSTTYADTFATMSECDYDEFMDYSERENWTNSYLELIRGASPGEVYMMKVGAIWYEGYFLKFKVSQDSMRTWSDEWTSCPGPDYQWHYDRDIQWKRYAVKSGWEPGELYVYLYETRTSDVPRVDLFRTQDFGQNWTKMYSSIDDVAVDEEVVVSDAAENIMIWPNPGNGRFTFIAPPEITQFRVYNTLGREVMRRELDETAGNGYLTIDMTGKSSGVYFLEVIEKNAARKTKNFILNK